MDLRYTQVACDMPLARYIRFADVSALRARWGVVIYIRVLSTTFAVGEHIAVLQGETISLSYLIISRSALPSISRERSELKGAKNDE